MDVVCLPLQSIRLRRFSGAVERVWKIAIGLLYARFAFLTTLHQLAMYLYALHVYA